MQISNLYAPTGQTSNVNPMSSFRKHQFRGFFSTRDRNVLYLPSSSCCLISRLIDSITGSKGSPWVTSIFSGNVLVLRSGMGYWVLFFFIPKHLLKMKFHGYRTPFSLGRTCRDELLDQAHSCNVHHIAILRFKSSQFLRKTRYIIFHLLSTEKEHASRGQPKHQKQTTLYKTGRKHRQVAKGDTLSR